jgi:ubiquinone biosynthesis protein COQ4
MGYQHLVNTLKAIAMTAPAARAFELTVEFALGQGIDEDTDYATMRVRETHDFHHIVTGFSMIGPGELGVIAITAL